MPSALTDKRLLAAAAVVGLVMVLGDLFLAPTITPQASSGGVVARVNGAPISREQLDRIVSGFESDTRHPASAEDRAHILDRLIEEELLVQRGIEVGMAEHDPAVRAALVQSMINLTTSEADAIEPKESDIRAYFEANKQLFASAPQLHLRAYWGAEKQRDPSVPDTLMPAIKLIDYLGPDALKAAMKLKKGETSLPIETPQGPLTIELIDKAGGQAPAYEDVKSQVRSAYLVERDEKALRNAIERLKQQADIERFVDGK